MEALRATDGDDDSSDSDSDHSPPLSLPANSNPQTKEMLSSPLPSPLVSLLHPPNSLGSLDYLQIGQPSRVRSFPHIEGNYAVSSVVPNLHVVDIDVPLNTLCKEEHKLEQVALGREFHISLGRTVPIRVHQIDSIVTMLR
ncbi:U6 snRNA phosphodiesterase-like [Gossypium australe]|uniref:U6 snRNA phosphodiesterase 1 n=1 Tax=Gossypium australe TaxID=47621 RepID=A0A5B6UK07_9ROSI|nr:U6 snRNA phosphodiesterase-like [Gossypium australe]